MDLCKAWLRPLFRTVVWPIIAAVAGLSSAAQADVALWSLQGAGGGRAILMGTVHLLPEDAKWQSKAIKDAVKRSDMLVLEALLNGENAERARTFALQNGFARTPQDSLPTLLAAGDVARLRAAERILQVPPKFFDGMQPWFAALNVSITYAMHHGFEPEKGAEQWLRARFEGEGRAVGPLESPSAGLEALSAMGADAQIEMLRAALVQVEDGGDAIGALFAAWQEGDMQALKEIMMAPDQFDAAVHEVVLTQRNANWVRPVLDYLKTPEEELIAVGAAHMVGPGNLIEMLEAAGVRVERLN